MPPKNYEDAALTPLHQQASASRRPQRKMFNKLAQALALLSALLLFALIVVCVMFSNQGTDNSGGEADVLEDPYSSSLSSVYDDDYYTYYEKSLLAVIAPTILNVCTGCNDTALCNTEGIPEACVEGWVRFDEIVKDDGEIYARITAEVTGLPPNSIHAWHVHESADSSGGDGFTLGGHFNPELQDHGCPIENGTIRHVGDLGNVQTDENGTVVVDMELDMIRFTGRDSILGRSLLIFQDPDECNTMAAGYRWGWGIIGVCEYPSCQDKFQIGKEAEDCFPEDWECGEGVTTPYPCCAGLKCEIYDEENDIGECIIDPGM